MFSGTRGTSVKTRCMLMSAVAMLGLLVAGNAVAEKGPSPAATKQLKKAAEALKRAALGKKKLARFFSPRVAIVYSTTDRSAGSCDAKATVAAKALDGVITLKGRVSGTDWINNKKIVPHATKVKLNLRQETFDALDGMGEKGRRCADRMANEQACLDVKAKQLHLSSGATSIDFYWRAEKGRLRVYRVSYSVEDPG